MTTKVERRFSVFNLLQNLLGKLMQLTSMEPHVYMI